jgi:predicted RNase H-like HicB family nuclease
MTPTKYVIWKDGEWWLGHLQDYPQYWTQGETLEDLYVHLRDLEDDFLKNLTPVELVSR